MDVGVGVGVDVDVDVDLGVDAERWWPADGGLVHDLLELLAEGPSDAAALSLDDVVALGRGAFAWSVLRTEVEAALAGAASTGTGGPRDGLRRCARGGRRHDAGPRLTRRPPAAP